MAPNTGSGVKYAHLADASVTYAKHRKRLVNGGNTSLNPGQFTYVIVGKGMGGLPLVVNIPELNPLLRYVNTANVFFSGPGGVERYVRFENPNVTVITFSYEIEMLEA
jgi:hypothetical protein